MSQRAKLIFAAIVLTVGVGWMYHTWKQYQPIRREEQVTQRRPQAQRSRTEQPRVQAAQADLTPEQRTARQHRALYRHLDLTDEQREQARAIEQRLQAQGEYHERDFRREFREILTAQQATALDEWQAERLARRQARPPES